MVNVLIAAELAREQRWSRNLKDSLSIIRNCIQFISWLSVSCVAGGGIKAGGGVEEGQFVRLPVTLF